MRHHVTLAAAALSAAVLAAAATGCSTGGSSGSSGATGGTRQTTAQQVAEPAQHSAPTTVTTRNLSVGKALVNDKGRTLYLFERDKSTESTCTGACAKAWPPLTVNGKPTAGGGVDAKKLGTSKRSDGSTQVTYNGHPLYRFAADTKAGDVRGQALDVFGGKWWAVGTDGKKITSSKSSSTSPGGGY